MSDSPNPYAVTPLDQDLTIQPIPFGGTPTRDDLMVSLKDSPQRSGVARLQYPLSLGFIIIVMVLIYFLDGGGRLGSIMWPVIAYPLLPVWLWFLRWLSPKQKRRRQRLEEAAKRIQPTFGWIDEEHVVVYEHDMFLRAQWSFFSAGFLFRRHLVLPISPDSTHRIVLPFRFFREPAELRQCIEIVGQKNGFLVNSPPNDDRLGYEVQVSDTVTPSLDFGTALSWDSQQWPFGSTEEDRIEFTVDLSGGQRGWRFSLLSFFGVLLFAVLYFLPIWVASLGWLISFYRATGNWSFLFDEIAATAIVVGPAAFILSFFIFNAVATMVRFGRVQSFPMSIYLRSDGVHLSHENFDSWFRWASVERVLVDSANAGWVIASNKDEARFPASCFESPEDFERFQTALQEFGNADHSTSRSVPSSPISPQ
ncbi:MAG: hypothetical protein AAGG48_15370 [Planctomycetota bacterium]